MRTYHLWQRNPLHGDLQEIAKAVQSYRFTFSRETELQEGVAAALRTLGCPMVREVWLSGADRIDFLIEGVGVEVKTTGSVSVVLAQVQRYAAHHQVGGLVLVTTCDATGGCQRWWGVRPSRWSGSGPRGEHHLRHRGVGAAQRGAARVGHPGAAPCDDPD